MDLSRLLRSPLRHAVGEALLSAWEWNSSGFITCLIANRVGWRVIFRSSDPEAAGCGENLRAELKEEVDVSGDLAVGQHAMGDVR